jgi:K+-sensing histidine kinase KdpD
MMPSWAKSRLLRSPPFWDAQFIAASCVAVAVMVRLGLTPMVGHGAPFVGFFPAILVASLGAGLGAGLSALVLSTLIADYLWLPPAFSLELTPELLSLTAFFWLSCGLLILVAMLIRSLVRVLAESRKSRRRSLRMR